MTWTSDDVEKIARAVLYEGHILYPYRRSSLKNRRPWSFGTLAPQNWAEHSGDSFQFLAECLAKTGADAELSVRLRCLHLSQAAADTEQIAYGESIERVVPVNGMRISDLLTEAMSVPFNFATAEYENGICCWRTPSGNLEIYAEQLAGAVKLTVVATNTTQIPEDSSRDEALLNSLVAAHAALQLAGGEFISLLDPPLEFAAAAARCKNSGVYPVLVGYPDRRDQMLASPIILYDYPEIAPESAGDFFDATEMDEMLSLRVATLTDEEKAEMSRGGVHARAILERTESLPPEQLLKTHGVIRGLRKLEEQR